MADRNKIIKNIKDGGSLLIYVGTASLLKPYIMRDNENRSRAGQVCSVAGGTVISLGVANWASKFFGKIVDEVADFIDDVKPPKKQEEDANA